MAPGITVMSNALARAMTRRSTLGATIRLPPLSRTRSTSSWRRTVPAPISRSGPRRCCPASVAASFIETKGDGEFSGISMASNPASRSALTMGSVVSGVMPRRMATRRRSRSRSVIENSPQACVRARFSRRGCKARHRPPFRHRSGGRQSRPRRRQPDSGPRPQRLRPVSVVRRCAPACQWQARPR